MKKIINKIINKIKNNFQHKSVLIWDHYYDWYIDNDDLGDPMTIVKVTYSNFKGIINVEFAGTRHMGFGPEESRNHLLSEFYAVCDINIYGGLPEYKKYSLLRNR